MGIPDKPIAPASPWQNGFAERLIGSIRRECADHIIVLGEAHLRQILKSYAVSIIRYGRTWLWIRMRRYRAPQRGPRVFFADQSSADCITNMSGFDFRQAQEVDSGVVHARQVIQRAPWWERGRCLSAARWVAGLVRDQ
jgi:hypothetical protein